MVTKQQKDFHYIGAGDLVGLRQRLVIIGSVNDEISAIYSAIYSANYPT